MWADRIFVAGLIVLAFIAIRLFTALLERQNLRPLGVMLVIAAAMLLYASSQKPGGYHIENLPQLVVEVFKGLL